MAGINCARAIRQDYSATRYLEAIDALEQSVYGDFVRAVRQQQDVQASRGRAAVIEFDDNQITVKQVQSAGELAVHLDKCLNRDGNGLIDRTVILEDLGLFWIQVLGSRLRIPPSLFAAHWLDPAVGIRVVNEDAASLDRERYFKLKVPQVHRVGGTSTNVQYLNGSYHDPNNNAHRVVQLMDKFRLFEASKHHISFWKPETARSKTSVILIDPMMTTAALNGNPTHILNLEHPLKGPYRVPVPVRASMQELPELGEEGTTRHKIPSSLTMCLFDITIWIIMSLGKGQVESKKSLDQIACSAIRNGSLGLWRTFLRTRELEYFRFCDRLLYSKTNSVSWYNEWDLDWREEAFRRLLFQQMALAMIRDDLREAMLALGIGKESGAAGVSVREREDWSDLIESVASLENKLSTLISGYTQETAVQESKTSNFQARSVGRLTSLATVLVPFSIIAGIFSMSGDFAAGQDLFWVFWVVVLSLVTILSITLFLPWKEILPKMLTLKKRPEK